MHRLLRQLILGRPRPPSDEVKNILVIRRNGIGDMVCALPVLRALKRGFPLCRITVLADRENAAIARFCEAVDEVLVFPLRPRLFRGRSWEAWRVGRELRKRKFDLVLGVSGSFSRLLARLVYGTGAPKRVGTISPERAPDPFYFTHCRIRPSGSRLHQVLTGVELLQTIGVDCDPDAIQLHLPQDEIAGAKRWLQSEIDPARPMVWLHLSNRRPESRWNAESFGRLAARLVEQTEACVVLARQKGDTVGGPELITGLPPRRAAWFENSSFVKFAAALSQARAVVCGDGGVMHLGAALGCRVVVLFSATEPEIWRPWGPDHLVLRRGPDVNMIGVDEVFDAVRDALADRRSRTALPAKVPR
jgi:ADP-heptose:LPS heptosyltransferase